MDAKQNTDSIERSIDIKAPGASVRGTITHPGYEHLVFEVKVDRFEPEQLMSFNWHPFAIDPQVDYSHETPTLVTFTLQELAGGTRLTVVESGFGKVPAERRLEAFRMNSQGWDAQVGNIARHVGG